MFIMYWTCTLLHLIQINYNLSMGLTGNRHWVHFYNCYRFFSDLFDFFVCCLPSCCLIGKLVFWIIWIWSLPLRSSFPCFSNSNCLLFWYTEEYCSLYTALFHCSVRDRRYSKRDSFKCGKTNWNCGSSFFLFFFVNRFPLISSCMYIQ